MEAAASRISVISNPQFAMIMLSKILHNCSQHFTLRRPSADRSDHTSLHVMVIHKFPNMAYIEHRNSTQDVTMHSGRTKFLLLQKTIPYTGKCEHELRSSMNHVWIDLKKGCAI